MASPMYPVAVRTLCEFAAKRGDLDLRFTPSPSAQEGMAGHRTVAARRSGNYRAEMPLSGRFGPLLVRGRADGYDPDRGVLEEVKTFKGDLARQPDNHRHLHWAQAQVYGWLLCQELGLAELTVSLVYFDIGQQEEQPPLSRQRTAAELKTFFDALCGRFLAWAESELAHRAERDAALTELRFPHADFRTGQRALATAVFNAARSGRCLMAQAPTGIGKTIGTLFPLLKACPSQAIDKVFFLTAKGSGRQLAFEALAALGRAPWRVLELVARDKACEHPDKHCHGDSCPLAKGFYDRLPAAREAAIGIPTLDRDTLREVAREHAVCPYYLGQELARWADVIVGDYNHFFDVTALLHGLTLANDWRVAVLVDEAHNLVDRARGMYSAALDSLQLRRVRSAAPEGLRRPLDRLQRQWARLAKEDDSPYRVLADSPSAFVSALQGATASIGDVLAEAPEQVDGELLRWYFDALQFTRLLESFGTHSMIDLTRDEAAVARPGSATRSPPSVICVRNVVPAPHLAPRFAAARSTVLFSATLAPQHFYADVLGLPADTAWLDVEAPFTPEQLAVRVQRVSTRYADRHRSVGPIVKLIADQYQAAPGNYLAFFGSHDYSRQVADAFEAAHADVPVWRQTRSMDEGARAGFLERFVDDGRGIGFAVLGGSFGEGIDLAGTRLIGAFIATLGLPQFNAVNEEMRRRVELRFGAGYDYTYLFPGLRKVVQAAGRVIRSPSDRGSVHLIDDRFGRPEVLRLLPGWWQVEPVVSGRLL